MVHYNSKILVVGEGKGRFRRKRGVKRGKGNEEEEGMKNFEMGIRIVFLPSGKNQ